MKFQFTIAILFGCIFLSFSQNGRNGAYFPTKGVLRALVVYYSFDNIEDAPTTIPEDAKDLLNYEIPDDADNMKGITRFIYQASFGKLIVLGDYVDEVLMLQHPCNHPYDIIRALDTVKWENLSDSIDYLSDIVTHNGYSVNKGDFDNWTLSDKYSMKPKMNIPDEKLDLLILIDLSRQAHPGGGHIYLENMYLPLKKMKDVSSVNCSLNKKMVVLHELAHGFIGGNLFHAGGANAGQRAVLPGMGGYSFLCGSSMYNLLSVNGWDRWRLGWFSDELPDSIEIGALNTNKEIVNADIDSSSGTVEFILRDFNYYGDAVRIKLPYIGTERDNPIANNQYIWLENHQLLASFEEHEWFDGTPKGIRVNRQIGNDRLDVIISNRYTQNHYIYPMCAFGNYDFTYDDDLTESAVWSAFYTTSDMENPFTGYHYLMRHPHNFNKDGELEIRRNEELNGNKMYFNGEKMPDNFFLYDKYVSNGSIRDVFRVGERICIASNPASNTVMTYSTPQLNSTFVSRKRWDSKYVYLSGLDISIVDEFPNADGNGNDVKVRICWDNYDVDDFVRWTGNIIVNENVVVKSRYRILLDQGLSPTKPRKPIEFKGEYVFADSTRCTFNTGSKLVIEDNASVVVKHGSTLCFKSGAELIIQGRGKLIIEKDGILELESNSSSQPGVILLEDNKSTIEIYNPSVPGSILMENVRGKGKVKLK